VTIRRYGNFAGAWCRSGLGLLCAVREGHPQEQHRGTLHYGDAWRQPHGCVARPRTPAMSDMPSSSKPPKARPHYHSLVVCSLTERVDCQQGRSSNRSSIRRLDHNLLQSCSFCWEALVSEDNAYYRGSNASFTLFEAPGRPAWRPPQLGALGALTAHWSLPQATPALVSLPTGTGKTAIAIAAAHLAGCQRVLVVVPSTELRHQMATAFRSEEVLIRLGALARKREPIVVEASRRLARWEDLEAVDVVVALPQSISPIHYQDNPPPPNLFDLVIVDEAHHAPAPTWRAILDHFSSARAVLLTATPRRRDGQRLPGNHIYHYPLRQALDEGIFKRVDARM